MIVPSLLKRWKRLESGFDASAQAYKALSDHFKDKTMRWLREDKAAQKDRQASPASMDIYDTVKEKGVGIYAHTWLLLTDAKWKLHLVPLSSKSSW
jgi:hypothetical protein